MFDKEKLGYMLKSLEFLEIKLIKDNPKEKENINKYIKEFQEFITIQIDNPDLIIENLDMNNKIIEIIKNK